MRFFEWTGATIAIVGLAMSVQVASADDCDLSRQTSCVVELVEITGRGGGGGGGGGGTGYPTSDAGGQGGNPTINDLAKGIYDLIEIICIKPDEPPLLWSARAQRQCREDVTVGLNQKLPFFSRSGIAINTAATLVCGPIVADKAPNGGTPC